MAVSAVMGALSAGTAALTGGTLMGGFLLGAGAAGTFLTHFLVSTAMGAALNALSPKPNTSGTRGYSIAGESGSALDHQIIYGRTRVGGIRVYDASTGSNNNYLHRIMAFAGHEIESYDEIYLNDEVVTLDGSGNVTSPSRYNGYVRINRHYGTTTQTADADLISDTASLETNAGRWTTQHRLQGIAYLYIRFYYNASVFPNGIPSVSATIKGKKVYDPRTSTTAWSDNSALCIRDYLTEDYGFNQPSSRIDDTLVITAANICDETVDSESRYTCNGNFVTSFAPSQVLSDLLTSMGGLLWYSQGKWRIKAAKYVTPTISLDESDLRSGISLSTRHSRRSNFNTVKGTFKGAESDWQESDYPSVTNSAYLAADNNLVNTLDYPLPFTSTSKTAQRLANLVLRRNREQLTFSASFGLKAFQVDVGDFIYINNSRFGWVNKPFEVTNWTFGLVDSLDLQVQMTLREISSAVFTAVNPAIFEKNNTTLSNPFNVGTVGIALSDELRVINEQVLGILKIDLSSGDPNVDFTEVEYKLSADTDFVSLGRFTTGRAEVVGVVDAYYDVRVRAVNYLGVRGPWNTVSNWFVSPFVDPPSDVTNFAGNVVGNSLHLTWTAIPDLDLSHYRVRYSGLTTGATYSNAVDVTDQVSRPATSVVVPARSGTYFIRAFDKLGNGSLVPTPIVVVTDTSNIDNLNVVETLTENPTFSGSKTNVALSEISGTPALVLDSATLFDSATGDFDDAMGLFDFGGGLVGSGSYEFSNYVDLGGVYVSRISTNLDVTRADYVNTFDSALGDFDSRIGLFDGDANNFDDISVTMQFATTEDDPSGSPTWSSWQNFFVADVTARAIKFRAILWSADYSASPAITNLSVVVDMPDRVESQSDLSFTGTINVTYPNPFKATPAIGLSLANMLSGQRYAVTSKTASGFSLTVYDSGGGVATNSVTLDYVAKGYGKGL